MAGIFGEGLDEQLDELAAEQQAKQEQKERIERDDDVQNSSPPRLSQGNGGGMQRQASRQTLAQRGSHGYVQAGAAGMGAAPAAPSGYGMTLAGGAAIGSSLALAVLYSAGKIKTPAAGVKDIIGMNKATLLPVAIGAVIGAILMAILRFLREKGMIGGFSGFGAPQLTPGR